MSFNDVELIGIGFTVVGIAFLYGCLGVLLVPTVGENAIFYLLGLSILLFLFWIMLVKFDA